MLLAAQKISFEKNSSLSQKVALAIVKLFLNSSTAQTSRTLVFHENETSYENPPRLYVTSGFTHMAAECRKRGKGLFKEFFLKRTATKQIYLHRINLFTKP